MRRRERYNASKSYRKQPLKAFIEYCAISPNEHGELHHRHCGVLLHVQFGIWAATYHFEHYLLHLLPIKKMGQRSQCRPRCEAAAATIPYDYHLIPIRVTHQYPPPTTAISTRC